MERDFTPVSIVGMDVREEYSAEKWSDGYRHGIRFSWDGVTVSIVFGAASYTNNKFLYTEDFAEALSKATTVEVGVFTQEEWIWPDVLGYVTKEELEAILSADKEDMVRIYHEINEARHGEEEEESTEE